MSASRRRFSGNLDSFERNLGISLDSYDKTLTLKDKQLECLSWIYKGRDVIANLPTGYGKSVIYHLLPRLLTRRLGSDDDDVTVTGIVLVVCPLNVIQEDQNKLLIQKSISACRLDVSCSVITINQVKSDVSVIPPTTTTTTTSLIDQVQNGFFDVVHCHPEALFCTEDGANLLDSESFQSRVVAVVIDECHTVDDWY